MSMPLVDLDQPRSLSGHLTGSHIPHKPSTIPTRYVYIHNSHIWRPPTDVYELEKILRIQTEVAGMDTSDFAVVVEGRNLRISGVRADPAERRIYHQLEIHTGEFMTEVELPVPVDANSMQVRYQDGFLIVEFCKLS